MNAGAPKRRPKSQTIRTEGMTEDEVTKALLMEVDKKNLVTHYVAKFRQSIKFSPYYTRDEVECRMMGAIAHGIVGLREYRKRCRIEELESKKRLLKKEKEELSDLKIEAIDFRTKTDKDFSTIGKILGYVITIFKNENKGVYKDFMTTKKKQFSEMHSLESISDDGQESGQQWSGYSFNLTRDSQAAQSDLTGQVGGGDRMGKKETILSLYEEIKMSDVQAAQVFMELGSSNMGQKDIMAKYGIGSKRYHEILAIVREKTHQMGLTREDFAA